MLYSKPFDDNYYWLALIYKWKSGKIKYYCAEIFFSLTHARYCLLHTWWENSRISFFYCDDFPVILFTLQWSINDAKSTALLLIVFVSILNSIVFYCLLLPLSELFIPLLSNYWRIVTDGRMEKYATFYNIEW